MKREDLREAEEQKARRKLDEMQRRWPFNIQVYQILIIAVLTALLIAVIW